MSSTRRKGFNLMELCLFGYYGFSASPIKTENPRLEVTNQIKNKIRIQLNVDNSKLREKKDFKLLRLSLYESSSYGGWLVVMISSFNFFKLQKLSSYKNSSYRRLNNKNFEL